MITKEIALHLCHGDILHHKTITNVNGSPARCRVNGMCKTWKRNPARFRLPVKYGLKLCFYIEPGWNSQEWECSEHILQRVKHRLLARRCGLEFHTPAEIVLDRAKELGLVEE